MDTLAIILSIIGGFILIATTLVSIWVIPLYRKLNTIHSKIQAKNDEIDAVEPDINGRTSGSLANEKQRLAQVQNAKVPLLRELERLEQERQFVVDKLPFFK